MLALVLSAPLLGVAPLSDALRWEAPPGCPDATRGRALVASYLGDGDPASIEGSVVIEAAGRGWRATIAPSGVEPRVLHADDCESLGHAAALVLVVSLAPMDAAARVASLSAEAPTRIPAAAPPPVSTSTPAVAVDEPAPRPRLRHGLGLHGGVSYGPVAAAAGVIRGGYRLGRAWWRIEVDAIYSTPRRVDYDAARVGGRFQAVSGSLRGCGVPRLQRLAFPLCVGPEAGVVFGIGVGFPEAHSGAGAWVGAVASPGLEIALTRRIALRVGADLLVSTLRPAFRVPPRPELFRTPWVGGRGTVGLEVSWGSAR